MEGRKTPLNEIHRRYGGKMVEFAGWELPVEYSGLAREHKAVRSKAGIFDVSHMGEVLIEGADALALTDYLVTNDIRGARDGQVVYTLMCNEEGGIVDDLLVYRYSETRILLVINAGNTGKDAAWIGEKARGYDVEVRNISDETAQLAVQGPKAQEILQRITEYPLDEMGFFRFAEAGVYGGIRCLISRTGYTGEDGFEIYLSPDEVCSVWEKLMEAGEGELTPAGLGARDTLRFEAGLPLYGNELGEEISPYEAGLGFFVKTDRGDFIGRESLLREKAEGSRRKTVGFVLTGRGIARHGYRVVSEGRDVGCVTTGYRLPGQDESIGLALVETSSGEIGGTFEIEVRKKRIEARIRDKKFYQKKYKR